MKERPILFSAPMVRAILAGTKTQTRRVVKVQPEEMEHGWYWKSGKLDAGYCHTDREAMVRLMEPHCPYGQPGDRLYIKEAMRTTPEHDHLPPSLVPHKAPRLYEADNDREAYPINRNLWGRYRHARFMPRWASRITLEITGVRVELLQDISEQDAKAEGINRIAHGREGYFYHAERTEPNPHNWVDPIDAYCELWTRINGPGSWERNQWVRVIEFRRVTP